LKCLRRACLNRSVGVSSINEQSSRSHFIFTIHVAWRHALSKVRFCGKLNLIDLAGSERLLKLDLDLTAKHTSSVSTPHQLHQISQTRERETLNINQSLSTLSKVFLSLTNRNKQHIPYRESKLTHYLKDSLGGDSKTMVIVQVSPAACDSNETISTLQFG
jgi:hypothetical protein